jgi:DNA-binding transcriptional LysR family regulator
LLPEVIHRFLRRYPDIEISLQDDTAQTVQSLVHTRRVDFGITSLWKRDPELSFVPLWQEPMGLVCRADHPLVTGATSLPWTALTGHSLIDNGTTQMLTGTTAEAYVRESPLYVSNMISLIALVEAGLAATILPYLAYPPDKPNLRFLPLTEPQVLREVGLLQTLGSTLSPAAQALKEIVVTSAQDLRSRPDQEP